MNNLIKGDQQNEDEVKPLKILKRGEQEHEHKLKPLSNLNGEEQIERELKLFMHLRKAEITRGGTTTRKQTYVFETSKKGKQTYFKQ